MENQPIFHSVFQMYQNRKNETLQQHNEYLARDHEKKQQKRRQESLEEHEVHRLHDLLITLVMEECCCYYTEKNLSKKFSAKNNMDPGEVLKKLKSLMEIKEMLINTQEFITHLLRHLSLLNMLIVHLLRSLLIDGPIDDQLRTIPDNLNNNNLNNENEDKIIICTFVPSLPSTQREEPHIDNNPINEFQTQEYIICAFPALYPTRNEKISQDDRNIANRIMRTTDLYWPKFHMLMPSNRESESTNHHHQNVIETRTLPFSFSISVITINPGLNSLVPSHHLCKKWNGEINNDLQDYIELVNKLQWHTRCSPFYCLHVNRAYQQFCKFGYSKENIEHTIYISAAKLWLRETENRESGDFIKTDDTRWTTKSPLKIYWDQEIYSKLIDLLGQLIDNKEGNITDNENNDFSDLGYCNMDQNHNWINDTRKWYSNSDLVSADTFVNQAFVSNQIEGNKENFFKSKTLILILALTGVAAFNINEKTIHLALSISIINNNNNYPLSNNGHAAYLQFQEVYKLDVVQYQFENFEEQEEFKDIILRSLNFPVAKILAIHTSGGEAKRTDSDIAHGLEAQLLLVRGVRIILTVNI
ncbi:hypothetical protein Glove_309g84 [Diversispora epigaea]|uniref:Uncharacterized protein n=1 Tax=Diversispora epigaea TaxID=1348612 RepID=A0A397HYF9_9GLOM|nr:hypothetical protein Glove_309g84 [Diversispora epigaea]